MTSAKQILIGLYGLLEGTGLKEEFPGQFQGPQGLGTLSLLL